MIINYILMYTNSPNDLLDMSYRVKSMSAPKKNSIKFYSLHLSSESIVCFCFLAGHSSVVLAPGLQTEGTRTAPSRSGETCPDPTQSTSTITCSFVPYDLVGGGEGRVPFHPLSAAS